MAIAFGDVFFVPQKFNPKYGGHYAVVLGLDKAQKQVYLQSLSSRMYKIFPNFGSFRNIFCSFCSADTKRSDFQKQLSGKYTPVGVDNVIFLNFKKEPYKNFLSKETFVCLKRFEKDNLFDFDYRVTKGDYKYQGNFTKLNCKLAIVTARESDQITTPEMSNMLEFFKQTYVTNKA